jgi:hypothetical protein
LSDNFSEEAYTVRRLLYGLATVLFVTSAVLVHAQKTTELKTGGGGSPHVRTNWMIDGANLTVEYGRPFLKGRPEAQMMPAGREWRTGADEATIMTSDKPLKFGAVSLAPGTYTINTVPGDKEWQIVFGRLEKAGQWGIPYQKQLEIGRTAMKVGKTAKPVENVTISIDDAPMNGALLRIEWGTTSVTTPFTIG